jgi:nucleoside-diphosphate-sugar epimerase
VDDIATVVITGASGFIGSHLVNHFANRRWKVIALQRKSPSVTVPKVEYVKYDLRDRFEDRMFSKADFLVHCAYIENSVSLNLEGTKRLLEASRKYGLKRNVFMSSVSAHESALSKYGKQKYLCEKLFDSEADSIIRPALVLGNGGLFQRMSEYLNKGKRTPLVSGGRQPVQIIWIHDLVFAIEKILICDLRGTFTVAHPAVVPYKEFCSKLSRKLGVKPRFVYLPYCVAKGVVAVATIFGMALPVTKENLLGLKAMREVDAKGDMEKLGISVRSFTETLELL